MEFFVRGGGDGELETRAGVGVGSLDSLLTYLGQPGALVTSCLEPTSILSNPSLSLH